MFSYRGGGHMCYHIVLFVIMFACQAAEALEVELAGMSAGLKEREEEVAQAQATVKSQSDTAKSILQVRLGFAPGYLRQTLCSQHHAKAL